MEVPSSLDWGEGEVRHVSMAFSLFHAPFLILAMRSLVSERVLSFSFLARVRGCVGSLVYRVDMANRRRW
jgi:hypothetical protein